MRWRSARPIADIVELRALPGALTTSDYGHHRRWFKAGSLGDRLRNAALLPRLRRWHGAGTAVAGICTGVGLVAESGILDGRPATTHWWAVDGGHEIAVQTAKALLLETPRTWQASYAVDPPGSEHDVDAIRRTQDWLVRHFRDASGVDELAARAGMSPRTFARRFKAATGDSPLGYLHRLRVDAARHLPERRSKGIREVGRAVGYEDAAFFRRLFMRYAASRRAPTAPASAPPTSRAAHDRLHGVNT